MIEEVEEANEPSFETERRQIENLKAIRFCNKFNQQKQWLVKNNCDLEEFPEYGKFNELINKFKLNKMA